MHTELFQPAGPLCGQAACGTQPALLLFASPSSQGRPPGCPPVSPVTPTLFAPSICPSHLHRLSQGTRWNDLLPGLGACPFHVPSQRPGQEIAADAAPHCPQLAWLKSLLGATAPRTHPGPGSPATRLQDVDIGRFTPQNFQHQSHILESTVKTELKTYINT